MTCLKRLLQRYDPLKPKKILIVASADSPLLRARALFPEYAGHQIVWFSESVQAPECNAKTYHARKHRRLGFVWRLWSMLLFWLALMKERPDIVHVHWAIFPALLLKKRWSNLIVSPMGSDIFINGYMGLRTIISRKVIHKATIITSKSEFMDQRINELMRQKTLIKRITWGIAPDIFRVDENRLDARKRLNLDIDSLVFFSPRANRPLYRIDQIIKAFADYLQKGGEGYLLVAEMYGSAETRAHLNSQIKSSRIRERVKFLGSLSTHQMHACYAAADAVVSYASTDGMPQTLYEAMAAGCFPVFTDLPQYRSLLEHGVNSFLCGDAANRRLSDGMAYAARAVAAGWDPTPNRELVARIASRDKEVSRMNRIYDLI